MRPQSSITVWIALAALCSLTGPPASGETTPPAPFDLLFPANHATTYATIPGGKPRLAWQAGAERAAGIDHYEIWLDGENVDRMPAGAFGHLPGEKHASYEPFRPFGFLPAEGIHYYTPQLSKLAAGPHQWHVEAVDKNGSKRRSDSVFHFTVEETDTPKVFVNHLGYLSNQTIRVVVDGGVVASSCELVDLKGTVVSSAALLDGGPAFGNHMIADLTASAVSGTYRIKAGSAFSMWFPVGLEAKLNYEDFLRKYRNAYRRKRCGDTTANWTGKPCHLEDARMDGDKRHGIVGGWHASSDVRKIMRILQPGLHGLVELKRTANPAWDRGDDNILDEIKWGNQYIHAMQLGSGALVQHYHLWCGATDWGEGLNRYTNNIIGDADDRVLPEKTLAIDMLSQADFIMDQTAIHRLYKEQDPSYAGICLQAATRCYDHFVREWPVVTDYKTAFNARPYMEPVSEVMPLVYGIRAHLSMYLATGRAECRDRAIALADQLMELQETGYVRGQTEVKGYFYADAKKDVIFSNLMGHGGLDGMDGGAVVFADLCDALPAHPKHAQWKECLRSYLEDNLLPLSRKNAFGITPAFLSLNDRSGGQTGGKMRHRVGGLHYQNLCDNRGMNMILARNAILLAKGARILGNPKLRDAAWRQIDWILGNNPLNASTVCGVGQGQPAVYKESLEPRSDGMVVQGIGGGDKDLPYMRNGHWRWCEMELHNTAWFAVAICELLTHEKP